MSRRLSRRLLVVVCTAGSLLIPVAVAWACVTPQISTSASSGTVGQGIHDVATLSGGHWPTGTISWKVYSAGDKWCKTPLNSMSSTPLKVTVNGNGTYTSPDFIPPGAGSYQWVATYSGDKDNYSISTKCNDKNEVSWVSPSSPVIATTASSGTVGGSIRDVATLSGGYSPTGTISWNVYYKSDAWCRTALNSSALTVSVNGDGTYTSPGFTPPGAGSYQWVATYSGDSNNAKVVSNCGDQNEISTVSPSSPVIATMASSGSVGGSIRDVATLSGGYSPTGTISWNVYSASDAWCRTALNSSPLTVSVNGDGTYTSPSFTPSSAGSYQWVATYSGDANNAGVASNCGDHNEMSTVTQPPPPGSPPTPGIRVVKLQRDGSSGGFTTGTITGRVGDKIEYEILVTDTGNTPLTLSISDPHCDGGTMSGPSAVSGGLSGDVLSPGAEAEYTCSHVLTAGDPSVFTNTATVTGQPPTGPPVSGSGTVSANKQAVKAIKILRCGRGKIKGTKRIHGKTVQVCVTKKKKVHAVVVHRRSQPQFTG